MSKHKQLIIICLLALVVTQVSIPEAGAAAPGTRVRIEPADLVVGLNETFVVQVIIEEAGDLGAFQFDLTYDPSIVQVTEAALGNFLGSTGRSMVPIGPEVNNAEGRVTLGAISLGSAAGPSGAGVLATITCVAHEEGSTALELREVQILNTAASVQRVTVEGGQVVVGDAEALTPATTPIPVPTSTPEAMDTPLPAATALPSPTPPAAPLPSPTPLATPAATGPSGGVVLGLMLAALAVAILAVFILSRRPGG